MRTAILAILIVALPSLRSLAGTGTFGSLLEIGKNGSNSWYDAQEWANQLPNFAGTNFGTFDLNQPSTDTLTLAGFQLMTWKNGGGDVTGASLLYRVYEQATTPGSFTSVNGSFISNATFTAANGSSSSGGGDQLWGSSGLSVNLLNGLSAVGLTSSSPRNYNIEVFFKATSNEGDRFSNAGGANFTASFSTIPEPSAASLMISGLAALLVLRRRKSLE